MVGQDGDRISLARLSVHGTRHASEETFKARRSGHQSLDKIAKIHDIDYSRAKNLQDKWAADRKMVKAIDNLPGRNTPTEFIVKHIMKTKRKLKL